MIQNFLRNSELLIIGELHLDTGSECTLRASLMSEGGFEKELEALDEFIKTKPLSSVVEEGKSLSTGILTFFFLW